MFDRRHGNKLYRRIQRTLLIHWEVCRFWSVTLFHLLGRFGIALTSTDRQTDSQSDRQTDRQTRTGGQGSI